MYMIQNESGERVAAFKHEPENLPYNSVLMIYSDTQHLLNGQILVDLGNSIR